MRMQKMQRNDLAGEDYRYGMNEIASFRCFAGGTLDSQAKCTRVHFTGYPCASGPTFNLHSTAKVCSLSTRLHQRCNVQSQVREELLPFQFGVRLCR